MLTQASRLFIVFIMLLGFAQIEAQDIPKGIYMQNVKRQAGTGNSNSTPPPNPGPSSNPDSGPSSSPDSGPSTTKNTNGNNQSTKKSTSVVKVTSIPTTIKVTTTNADGNTVTKSISTHKISKTTATVKNSIVSGDKTTFNAATLTQKTVFKSPLVSSKTVKSTFTSFFTSNGVRHSTVITTNVVVPTTTGFAQTTINPSLADGGGSGSSLSGGTKAVIGGVVGGIGGAVIIGGLAFVLWRVYSRRKQEDSQDDYHTKYSGNRESSMYGSEGYGSSYGGRVNTASNF